MTKTKFFEQPNPYLFFPICLWQNIEPKQLLNETKKKKSKKNLLKIFKKILAKNNL